MKKEFMEPEMRRIELNLKENIAISGGTHGSYATRESGECTDLIVGTEITPSELDNAMAALVSGSQDPNVVNIVVTASACYRGQATSVEEAVSLYSMGL